MTRFTKDTAMKLIKIFLAEAAFLGIATMLERYGGDMVAPLLLSGFTVTFILLIWRQ